MAITFDTSAKITGGAQSGSYTVGAGSHACLFVFCSVFDGGSGPTGVTYNGISMTNIVLLTGVGSGSGPPVVSVFQLYNPPQGSSLTVNITGANSGYDFIIASYFGCTGIYPIFQSVQEEGDGSTLSLAITPTDTLCWVIGIGNNLGGIPTLTGVTTRQSSSLNGGVFWADSNGAVGGSLYTITITTNNLQFLSYAECLLVPWEPFTITPTTGAYALTGKSVVLSKFHQYLMTVVTGMYSLTGIAISLIHKLNPWSKQNKSADPTYTHQGKHVATFNKTNRSTTVWTKQNKS